MAPVGRGAIAPPQMRPPMMAGPPTGMMQGNFFRNGNLSSTLDSIYNFFSNKNKKF